MKRNLESEDYYTTEEGFITARKHVNGLIRHEGLMFQPYIDTVETFGEVSAIFLGGALAISAWILPGISGSYILLILGIYPTIIGAIASFELSTLTIFSLGCVFGIFFFVRAVDWVYTKHADRFISFVVGFMLMSLVRLWPWQAEHPDGVGSGLGLLGPNQYEALTGQSPYLSVVLVFAFLGIGSLWLINRRK